ncbi:MAG: helix-turn-helix transcriptional regulator [Clostridia bacterium]|nr:helix-turn-helix transcriptional regulator [Clostridia bacterium]
MIQNFIRKRVATLRLSKNLSARKLSIELGQGPNYITHIENGQSNVSIESLENICDYFEISLADFFDGKTEYPLQYRKIIDELNKLDSIEIEKVYDMIKLVTDNKKKI